MSEILRTYGGYVKDILSTFPSHAINRIPAPLVPLHKYHCKPLRHSKGFRPALISALAGKSGEKQRQQGLAIQYIHESSLIIDDIIDRDIQRRGQRPVHMHGRLLAGCLAAWYTHESLALCQSIGPQAVSALNRCLEAFIIGESLQKDGENSPRPFAIARWEEIALNDTGGLMRFAATLGLGQSPVGDIGDEIHRLSVIYHGLDDIQDILEEGTFAGGTADIRDEVPTLLTCFVEGKTREDLLDAVPLACSYLKSQFLLSPSKALHPFFADLNAIFNKIA